MQQDSREFEERADFIEEADLMKWTVSNQHFAAIQKKMTDRGAKLLVGPRGTGKTHQFKNVVYACSQSKELPLAIYVSFGKYYHLEPLLFKVANAISIFHTWVLSKILIECTRIAHNFNINQKELLSLPTTDPDSIQQFIERAEKNIVSGESDQIISEISIQKTIAIIENLCQKLGRKRAVLLLDDAALTLTPDYMVEFFDVFRSLKTNNISPKASVYPGTTQYGPRFHLGQDAEQVLAWLNVEDESYSSFMNELIERRFSFSDSIETEIIELIKYASFGIPRAFITLIRNYLQDTGRTKQQKFNNIISNQSDMLRKEYLSLALKIPQYKTIIRTGLELFDKVLLSIKEANKDSPSEKKAYFGLLEEGEMYRLDRMMKFLIEAGFLYEISPINDGPNRKFLRYIPHYLFLIENRTFSHTKGFNPKDTVEYIKRKTDKRPIRKQLSTILSTNEVQNLKLNLPACSKCRTERISEEQKFCHNCGNPLIGQSAFENVIQLKIEDLPIPAWQIARIKSETKISTIEHILMAQSPTTELKKAKYIGDVRSSKIYKIVIDLLDEFLA